MLGRPRRWPDTHEPDCTSGEQPLLRHFKGLAGDSIRRWHLRELGRRIVAPWRRTYLAPFGEPGVEQLQVQMVDLAFGGSALRRCLPELVGHERQPIPADFDGFAGAA